jgi:small-conductance mechanosensitive channel
MFESIKEFLQHPALNRVVLGADLGRWIVGLAVWAVVALGLMLLVRVVRKRLEKLAPRTKTKIDDVAVAVLGRTASWFLVAVGAFFAIGIVQPDETTTLVARRIVFVLLLLQLLRWGGALIRAWVQLYSESRLSTDAASVTTVRAVGFLIKLSLWVVVLLLALDNFGVNITALVAGLGVGGIAVALALQNILGDLFASLSIVLDKPFVIGDFLIVGDYLGVVENVGLKTTRIRSLSGEQIVMSNNDLLQSRIRNYKRMYERRVPFEIGVVYGTPLEKVRRIPDMIRGIIEAREQTRFDRAHFKAYGESSLKFEIVYYVLVPDYNVYMDIQQDINLAIGEAFEREGIEFAFPTRTIHVASREVSETV